MKRIILDVDDVLNGLTFHILRHYGCDVGPFEYSAFPVEVGYDIISACKMLGGNAPSSPAEFWDGVTAANLWRTAPKSPECDELLDLATAAVGRSEVYLATSPTKDPQSHADKLHWVWDHLPDWIHRQYFITPRKWLLGKPGVTLFDDHTNNCIKFNEEGGSCFLVPRPWNPHHPYDTIESIRHEFEQMKGGESV